MDISEKFCPVCKNKNDRDAFVCVHCGAPLETSLSESAATRTTEMPADGPWDSGESSIGEVVAPAGGIAFYVEGTAHPFFSYFGEELVVGRKVDGTSEPMLDLAPLGGYHQGLSRRHALIRRAGDGYEIIDLSSANGTWLNDERLIPNKPYPLASGSQLRFARMRLFVLYGPDSESS